MARKIFISVLGTGFYEECRYATEGFVSHPTRYIQSATIELLNVAEWESTSAVYILITKSAATQNWESESGFRKDRNGKNHAYAGLRGELSRYPNVQGIPIPDGKNEEEMWAIFSTVFDKLQEGDELYFDLTHSFRYLPMLILVLGNYAKFLKNVMIRHISYGNYEALDKETGIAPIIDLLPLSALQDWTFAAANFVKNGDVANLVKLSEDKLIPVLKRTEGKDANASELRKYIKTLKQVVEDLRFCRGNNLYEAKKFKRLQEQELAAPSVSIKPLAPIIADLQKSLSMFDTTPSSTNCLKAAQWCYDKGLYQSSVTFLQEGIVTFFCQRYGVDPKNKEEREAVNKAFKKREFELLGNPASYKRETNEVLEPLVDKIACDDYLQHKELVFSFSDLSNVRNDFNHSGMRRGTPLTGENLKKAVNKYLGMFLKILLRSEPSIPAVPLPPLFVNLSNHPTSRWSEEQCNAAASYGKCIDMPFPVVNPMADEEEIREQVDKIAQPILEQAERFQVTVHVMGEMTTTFALVKLLSQKGISCVASTSYRIVEELTDGTKRVDFRFNRFRRYDV